MIWYKCLRQPCYSFTKKLKINTLCKKIFCKKGAQTDKKCFCFHKDCNNNWALLVVLFLYALFVGLSFVPAFVGYIQSSLAMITVVLGYWLWQVAPAIIGRMFYFIVLFQVMWQFLLGGGALTLDVPSRNPPVQTNSYFKFNHFANGSSGINWPKPKWTNLPICHQRYGIHDEISVLDLAFLSNSIYEPDGGKMAAKEVFSNGPLADHNLTMFTRQFSGTGNGRSGQDSSLIQWARWDFNNANTTIFVVRGTSNVVDAMQDMSYYSIASSLKVVLEFLLPIQHILPSEFIQELIKTMLNSAFEPIEYLELLHEINRVNNGIRKKRDSQSGKGGQTIITGHSLGGAYANIAGKRHILILLHISLYYF